MLKSRADTVSKFTPWYILGVLVIIYFFSMIDRQIISMLIGGIKKDLGLGDFHASLLMGTAFGVFYVLFGVPFGWLADRFPRRLVIFCGVLIWSVACMAGGFTSTFVGLFLCRMMVGAGEASLSPCAYSMISENFAREKIGTPLAIYHLGASVGGALALVIGGIVADTASALGPISVLGSAPLHPWQIALIIVGAPGILLALLALTLPERSGAPQTPRADAASEPAAAEGLLAFARKRRALVFCHFMAFALALIVVMSNSFWMPEFLSRTYGWTHSKIGVVLGSLGLLGPIVGQTLSAVLIGQMQKRGYKDASLRAYLIVVVVAIPAALIAFTVHNPFVFMAALFVLNLCTTPLMTYGSSAIQLFTPRLLRGRMSGAFLSFTSLVGLAIGPAAVGFAVQYIYRDEAKIGLALCTIDVLCLGLVAVLVALGLRPLRRAVLEQESLAAA